MPDNNGDLGVAPGGYPLGVKPSPPDERDRRYISYGLVYKDLPNTFTVPGIHRIDNQGGVEACVACSIGLAKDWQEGVELGYPVRFSRAFIYANRNKYDHQGPGMVPRCALGRLRDYGVCTEDLWPGLSEYGQETWPERDPLLAAAKPFRIDTYVRIEQSFIPEIKSAVYTLGPVLYCVPIHDNFAPNGEGVIPLPSGTLCGYHAMAVVGWKHGLWLVQNSWGESWGQGGRCWIPWAFPALEVWGITDAETPRYDELLVIEGEATAWLNGRSVAWDRPAMLINDRFMVPARHYSETVGDVVLGHGRLDAGEYAGRYWAKFGRRVR